MLRRAFLQLLGCLPFFKPANKIRIVSTPLPRPDIGRSYTPAGGDLSSAYPNPTVGGRCFEWTPNGIAEITVMERVEYVRVDYAGRTHCPNLDPKAVLDVERTVSGRSFRVAEPMKAHARGTMTEAEQHRVADQWLAGLAANGRL